MKIPIQLLFSRILPLALILIACLPKVPVLGQNQAELASEIEKMLTNEYGWVLEENQGILIGVSDGDSNYLLPIGEIIPGRAEHGALIRMVEIGSLSKLLTAEIVVAFAERGTLTLEDRIDRYLGDVPIHEAYKDVTIRDLLLHTSGLPKYPDNLGAWEDAGQDPFANYPKSAVVLLLNEPPLYPVKGRMAYYSHVNYALLEIVLEEITGSSFEKIINLYFEEILPENQYAVITRKDMDFISPGYDMAGRKIGHRQFMSFAASEGMALSPQALMDYLKYLLDHTQNHPPPTLFEGEIPTSLSKDIHIGFGSFIARKKRFYPIFVQNGKAAGHSVFLAFVRETGTGVFVISNSSFGSGDLGMMILRMVNQNWKRKH